MQVVLEVDVFTLGAAVIGIVVLLGKFLQLAFTRKKPDPPGKRDDAE